MHLLASNPLIDSFLHSDAFGKVIFFSLFFLSLITWHLFFTKWRLYRDVTKRGVSLQKQLANRWQNPLKAEPEGENHPYLALWQEMKEITNELMRRKKSEQLTDSDYTLIEEDLFAKAEGQVKKFEKNLFHLSTVVTLAPFLGLLGTVWGILLTFAQMQKGGASHANETVMNGLAMALGTTVLGLLVAIPALLFYNYLKSKLLAFSYDMEAFTKDLLCSLQRHRASQEEKRATP